LPAAWCAAGDNEPSSAQPVRATPGVRYRWLEADVRAIGAQVRARDMTIPNALRALRPRARTAHSIEDWRDPGPMLLRATQLGRPLARGSRRVSRPLPSPPRPLARVLTAAAAGAGAAAGPAAVAGHAGDVALG